MAIAKFYIILLVVITQINAEMFPSFSQDPEDDDQRTPHKIILRSKRQQCVCVSVTFPNTPDDFDPSTSSFQCSCDPSSQSTSSASYYQTPLQRQYQQQQELQRELQQAQTLPKSQSTSCGCQLAPQFTSTATPTTAWSAVSFGTTQSPFDFFQKIQQTTPSPNNNNYYGNNEIGNNNNNNNVQPLFDCQCVTTPQQNVDISQNNLQPTFNPAAYNPTAYDPAIYSQSQQYPQQQQQQQQQQQHQQQQQQQQQQYLSQQQQPQQQQPQQEQYPQRQQPQYVPPQQQQVPAYLPPPSTTSTTPAPIRSTTTTTPSPQYSQNSPRCKCVEIQILLADPQIQCDCNGQGNGQETRPPFLPPQYTTTTTTRVPFPQYTTTTTQGYYQTTTLPSMTGTTRGAPPQYTTPPTNGRPTTAPDALPCVMIQIRTGQKVCACQENYKQCSENVCCNVDKYRSLKVNDDPRHPSPPSAGAATVDLLVDLLQKVRESLV